MIRAGALKVYSLMSLIIFSFLSLRLLDLQVVNGEKYAEMSYRNAIRLITVPAPRGIIYDRKGYPIVTSRMSYRIFLDTRYVKKAKREYSMLSELLNISASDLKAIIDDPKRRAFEPAVLMNDADAVTVSRILEHKAELPGVTVDEFPTRQYVYGEFATHLVGYLSEINADELAERKGSGYRMGDLIGKAGIEKVYEPYLKGVDGGLQVEVNNLGEPIKVLGTKPPIPGNDVFLTIDQKVQATAERAFNEHLAYLSEHDAPNADAGSVIAMDPRTGRIIAMVSKPGYDPNIFVSRASRPLVSKLFSAPRQPSLNRAIYGEYPYGSTFKMITGMAALQEGKVNMNNRFYCNGYDPVYPKKKCWTVGKGIIHGTETVIDGYKNSCNIVFYELGRNLGPDRLAKWAKLFGFGEITGIELPGERDGLVPTKAWKRKAIGLPWYFPESMDFGIGQGFMNGTPLQIARAYSALLNGGVLYRPQVVSKVVATNGKVLKRFEPEPQGTVPFDPKNAEIVRKGLEAVIAPGGTAHSAFRGFPIIAGGKTGTAQNPQGDNHGWFVGYAPADKPEIVVVVLVERGKSGGGGAAPIARKIMEAYFGLVKETPPPAVKTEVTD